MHYFNKAIKPTNQAWDAREGLRRRGWTEMLLKAGLCFLLGMSEAGEETGESSCQLRPAGGSSGNTAWSRETTQTRLGEGDLPGLGAL